MTGQLGGGTPITISPAQVTGTLGCLASLDGVLCILSSGHVMTRFGGFSPPELLYQYGGANLTLGEVYKAAAPNPYGSQVYQLDAALARVTAPGAVTASIGQWGPPQGPGPAVAAGDVVFIWGAMSPRSSNTVVDPNWSGRLAYPGGGVVSFSGLVKCHRYGWPGDSGAIVLNDAMQVVGLHVGGSSQFSYFCPLASVMAEWPTLKIL